MIQKITPTRARWRAVRPGATPLLLVAALFLAPLALAQSTVQPTEPETPARSATQRLIEAEDAERSAREQDLFGTTRIVTFEDVLANPDDIEINIAWARIQIARGDVKGAAGTFERILLINPDLPRVKLLYAIVLYRLDSIDEAERELRAVRQLEMPASLRAEIDRYLDQIALRRKTTRYSLTISVGAQYDWNRNAAPDDNRVLLADLEATVGIDDQRKHDFARNTLARYAVTHDLGYQARHLLNGAVNFYDSEQSTRDELDLRVVSAEFGGVYDAAPVTIAPTLYTRYVTLAKKRYAVNNGINLLTSLQHDADTALYVLGEAEYQEFYSIEESLTAPERTGAQYVAGVGAHHVLNPAMRLSVEARETVKRAARNYNAYHTEALNVSHTWLIGGGAFLITNLTGERRRYAANDPAVSALTRHDLIGRAYVTLGMPLRTLLDAPDMPEFFQDIVVSVSAEASRQLSNLPNYQYDNRRFSAGALKRWEF
jgi:hypothetical protein